MTQKEIWDSWKPPTYLEDCVRLFISILEIEEESDRGTVFHPNQISSCRVWDTHRIRLLLAAMKEHTKLPEKPFKGQIHNWKKLYYLDGYTITGTPVGHPLFKNWIWTSKVVEFKEISRHRDEPRRFHVETLNSYYELVGEPDAPEASRASSVS